MMGKSTKRKTLSLEETVEILGAEPPEDVGPVQLHPIGMQVLATRIGARLVSKGGRPTDESLQLSRKIRMKESTWKRLKEIAESVTGRQVRVAPGQVAAVAMERGVAHLLKEARDVSTSVRGLGGSVEYEFHEESRAEAENLSAAISKEGMW